MIFLKNYKEAIGKTVKEVREFEDGTFDDPIQFTLILFSDDSALLIVYEFGEGELIDNEYRYLEPQAKMALGL